MTLVESGSDRSHGLTEFGPFWPRYDVRVVEGMLVFATKLADQDFLPEVDTQVTRHRPGRRFSPLLLDRFVELPRRRDRAAAVATFAARFGRLGLCRHGLPNRHHERVIQIDAERDCWDLRGPEPLEAWLYWARRAGAMLELADALKEWRNARAGELAARTLMGDLPPYPQGRVWDTQRALNSQLADLWGRPLGPGKRPRLAQQRSWPQLLRGAVEQWARYAGLEYTIRWVGRGMAEPDLRYGDLYGLIGARLLRRIIATRRDQRGSEVLHCQAPDCGVEFERWQRHGPARYCRQCSESGIAQRLAEERRQAKRGATRMRHGSAGEAPENMGAITSG